MVQIGLASKKIGRVVLAISYTVLLYPFRGNTIEQLRENLIMEFDEKAFSNFSAI